MYVDGAAGQNGRKIMLLYTDGGDTRSAMRFSEMLDLLKASDVTVYVIGVLRAPDAGEQGRAATGSAADRRGDRRPGVLPAVGQEPRLGLREGARRDPAQYTVGYVSTNDKADGTWRKIELKVNRKDGRDYRLRARKGYYAVYRKP